MYINKIVVSFCLFCIKGVSLCIVSLYLVSFCLVSLCHGTEDGPHIKNSLKSEIIVSG